jgi:septum formation protein
LSTKFILASASIARRDILEAARIPFEINPASIDEEIIKERLHSEGASAAAIASTLAEQKAMEVSAHAENSLVLGADQILVCEGQVFNKAKNLMQARESLKQFRGRRQELISAVALVRDKKTEWLYAETAELWVRDFSDAFLDDYLEQEGIDILSSVGCYRIEGRGAQLFEKITGNQFTIRGLPLFPLLGALRARGIIQK